MDYSSKAARAKFLFALIGMMMSSELVLADEVRECVIINGVRHCTVISLPPGGPGFPPVVQPPYNPPPHYPPPHNPPPHNPPPHYPPPQPPLPPPYYPPHPPVPPGSGYNYTIDQFRREESEVLNWDQQYMNSTGWNRDYALQQRDNAIQRAQSTLSAYRALEGIRSYELESLSLELDQKYMNARSGSGVRDMYLETRNIVLPAFQQAAVQEAQYARSYRDIEYEIERTDREYMNARSGSGVRDNYLATRNALIQEAHRRADQELRYLSQPELYRLQDEYQNLYMNARSGSGVRDYYLNIRNLARNLLSYHP